MTQLNYIRYGKGPALVLLHGFVGGSGYWFTQHAELQESFDVIAIDMPGFAGSAHIPAPDSLAGYARAVVERLDSLGVKEFSLLGF